MAALLLTRTYPESVVTLRPCSLTGSDQTLSALAGDLFVKLKISGGFLISKDGVILAQGFCGTSDPATRAPVDSETKFNIGSLTKQFTGYLLWQLKQENKLKLEDPVSKYIPELSSLPMGRVTLDLLMRMRAGVPYILPVKDFLGVQLSSRIRTQDELIQKIANLELVHEPGTQFEYSNLSYNLLGVVVSRVEGRSWAESVRRRIFIPFVMNHTSIEGEVPARPDHLAVGLLPFIVFSKTWFLSLPHWNYSLIKGAGGIVSTVEDLHRWDEGLTHQAQKDPSLAGEYFPSGPPSDENYAYGWFRSENKIATGDKIETINHGGEDPGYCASNIRLVKNDAHIVLTTNSDYCAFKEGAYREFTRAVLTYLRSASPHMAH